MAVYTYVNIKFAGAKRLADLYGIGHDIRACSDYCEKYLQTFAAISQPSEIQPTNEGVHLECFSAFIFIKYGRCFKGGIRDETSKEILATLSPEDLKLHQLAIDIRDKYIAHSVNDLETHKVRVWLNPEEKGRKINNVNIESHYVAGQDLQIYQRLKQLISRLLSWIDAEKKREETSLIKLVGHQYDLDYLYSQDAEPPEDIDYSRASKPRRNL